VDDTAIPQGDGLRSARVVHLSSVHFPDDPRIAIKECGTLADAGFDVLLICPESSHSPLPERVTRLVPAPRGRIARMTITTWNVFRAALHEHAQVYHFHDSELLPIAPFLRLTGAAVVYDVHEDVPKSIRDKPWIPWALRAPIAMMASLVEWTASRAVSGVVAATPQIARRFPGDRTVVVQNFSMIDELEVANPTPYASREPLFVYVGAGGVSRGSREMVRAIGMIPPSFNARLVLGGPINENGVLENLKTLSGWDRVEQHDWLTRPQVAHYLDRARAGIVTIHPTGNYVASYPIKVFEYMAAGLPLIVSDFKLWRELFEGVGCAIFVDPLDPAAIAAAMQWILEHPERAAQMGANGRLAAQTALQLAGRSDEVAPLLRSDSSRTARPQP
jgi:glycosyltransferase involved in cell wall biosynthesis